MPDPGIHNEKQNVTKDPGVRERYVVPEGKVMLSVDYSQLELCTLAEHCWVTFGQSRMRELINQDIDLHCYIATKFYGREITKEDKKPRAFGKVLNFGSEFENTYYVLVQTTGRIKTAE